MRKERYSFCTECRKECLYRLQNIERQYDIKGKKYNMEVTVAICKNCGEEMNIPGILDLRAKEVDEQYRKIENIISICDIEKLMKIYHIGKAPLSLPLGFGEITITRYLQGQVPSKEYSDIMRRALESPEYMISRLQENKGKIGKTAYSKAMKAAMELGDLFNLSEKMLSTISYIFEKTYEITPLALQKLLYFIQGIYMVFYRTALYEEDCCAWVHGPVYEKVYELFKTFQYNPIDDSRFVLLKNRFQELSKEEKEVIDLVIDTFGMYSGKVLETITHREGPWQSARGGYLPMERSNVVIEKEEIFNYFKEISEKYDFSSRDGIRKYIDRQLEVI